MQVDNAVVASTRVTDQVVSVRAAVETCRWWVVIVSLPVAAACTFNMSSRTKIVYVAYCCEGRCWRNIFMDKRLVARIEQIGVIERIYLLESVVAMM